MALGPYYAQSTNGVTEAVHQFEMNIGSVADPFNALEAEQMKIKNKILNPGICRKRNFNTLIQVLQSDLVWTHKWPFGGLCDLRLGNQKVTLKKLDGKRVFQGYVFLFSGQITMAFERKHTPIPKSLKYIDVGVKNLEKTHLHKKDVLPSGELTYLTWGKGKSSSNIPWGGDILVLWKVSTATW